MTATPTSWQVGKIPGKVLDPPPARRLVGLNDLTPPKPSCRLADLQGFAIQYGKLARSPGKYFTTRQVGKLARSIGKYWTFRKTASLIEWLNTFHAALPTRRLAGACYSRQQFGICSHLHCCQQLVPPLSSTNCVAYVITGIVVNYGYRFCLPKIVSHMSSPALLST